MIKENKRILMITSLIILLPVLVGLLLWHQLPEQIPVHFNSEGVADSYQSKLWGVTFIFPDYIRIRQCHPESAPCHCFSSGCGRCRYFDSYCTDDLMYPCPDLSLPFRQQLPASLFKAENPAPVYETDFSGGCSCRYPEYRH